MQLELLYKSTMQMKDIAINLDFQLELSFIFLGHSIPVRVLYFNGPKFSSFHKSEKNSVHLQFLHVRLSLALLAFQSLSHLENNLKDNFLNGP